MRDPYQTLGVKKNANTEEIKAAFRKLAKEHHPDRGGDSEKFKQINEAYAILSDNQKKAQYDASANSPFGQNFNNTGGFQHTTFRGAQFNFNDFFSSDDFMDIFGAAAGFPGSRRRAKNNNVRIRLVISLESLLEEQNKTININDGTNNRQIEIKIPAGIHDGAVITYRGLGQQTFADQPPGDLMVEIIIEPNKKFKRANEDLHSEITVDCFKATVGTQIEFETIRGRRIKVHIPAGSQTGTVLRLPGEGLPSANKSKFIGSQFLKINVMVPTNLTAEQIALVKQIISLQEELNS